MKKDVFRLVIAVVAASLLGAARLMAEGTPGVTSEVTPAPSVLGPVLEKIRLQYVDPSRVDPRKMLWSAARALDREIPEVLLESTGGDVITLLVAGERATFQTSTVRSLAELRTTLAEMLRFIGVHRSPSSKPNAEYVAVNGMLTTLDPHSSLFTPEEAKEFRMAIASRFSGVGIVFGAGPGMPRANSGIPVVEKVFPGGPAEGAGFAVCDAIVGVEDRFTAGMDWDEIIGLLRGPTGSPVWITLGREGRLIDVVLTRDQIRVPSVSSRRLDGGVGLVRIERFVTGTGAEVRAALAEMKKGGATAWILDLRDNPGGLLKEAIAAASAFLPSGPVVTVAGAGGRDREVKEAKRGKGEPLEGGPVLLLVSPSTASAAEVFAAALQSRNRAAILGRTTFGKGSVQVLFDNTDGSILKLTIALYLPPGGASLQARGITPDIELDPVPVPRDGRVRLTPSELPFREATLDRAFSAREAERKSETSLRYLAASPDAEEEVRLARELLVATRPDSRGAAVARAKPWLDERRSLEEVAIGNALGEAGVDWSARSSGERPRLRIRCAQAGPPVRGRVSVTCDLRNESAHDAFRVLGRVPATSFDFAGEEVAVGRIPAGSSRQVRLDGVLAEDSASRVSYVRLGFSEEGEESSGADVESIRIEVPARPRESGPAGPAGLEIAIHGVPADTVSATVPLTATIRDASGVLDAWVAISNRSAETERKKIAYVARKDGPDDSLLLSSEISLQVGLNEVFVCARGKHRERCEKVFVFRRTAEPVASK